MSRSRVSLVRRSWNWRRLAALDLETHAQTPLSSWESRYTLFHDHIWLHLIDNVTLRGHLTQQPAIVPARCISLILYFPPFFALCGGALAWPALLRPLHLHLLIGPPIHAACASDSPLRLHLSRLVIFFRMLDRRCLLV